MLTCAIVYATPHTNARRLAETMYAVLGPQQCIYMGMMDDQCLLADVIFWGRKYRILSRRKLKNFWKKSRIRL